jgi:hypothetical protein
MNRRDKFPLACAVWDLHIADDEFCESLVTPNHSETRIAIGNVFVKCLERVTSLEMARGL